MTCWASVCHSKSCGMAHLGVFLMASSFSIGICFFFLLPFSIHLGDERADGRERTTAQQTLDWCFHRKPCFHSLIPYIYQNIYFYFFPLSLVCSILRMRGPGVDTQFLTGPFALLNKKLEIRPFHASIPSADTWMQQTLVVVVIRETLRGFPSV